MINTINNTPIDNDISNLIDKYYPEDSIGRSKYVPHVEVVASTVQQIIDHNSSLKIDRQLAINGAYLHDIGICMTNEPRLGCYGQTPYIQHGICGRDILLKEGFEKYAMFCERHIGIGLSKEFAIRHGFPLPQRDMNPKTIEEKIVCFADKFFSKSKEDLTKPEDLLSIRKEINSYGCNGLKIFDEWCKIFGTYYIYK